MAKIDYKADRCECCGQTTTYIVAIDKGAVNIMKKIAKAVEKKGINCLHLAKERVLNHSELCNIIRPRFHGLVAHVEGEKMKGNFCLTNKGIEFLNGAEIPRYAVVSKAESRQVGYFDPENLKTSISTYNKPGEEYWESCGFEIESGQVVPARPMTKKLI